MMLGLSDILDDLAKVNSVCWYQCVLSRACSDYF